VILSKTGNLYQKVISLLCKKDYYEHYLFISFWLLFMTGMRIGESITEQLKKNNAMKMQSYKGKAVKPL